MFLAAACAMGTGQPAAAQVAAGPTNVTVIHAGRLLDRPGLPSRGPSSIVVSGGKVQAVLDGFVVQPNAKVIDLRNSFVLPGLIDAHVHIAIEFSPSLRSSIAERSPASFALDGAAYASRTLQAGFTTVRDLGSPSSVALALRDAVEANRISGPTILAAGRMISATAGHADLRGFNESTAEGAREGYLGIACDGADDCRKRVREQIRASVDVIKLAVTGGVLTESQGGLAQQMSDVEIAAAVSAAKQYGLRVAAHAHSKEGINAALTAGVDSIEHGSFLDEASVPLFIKSRAYLVPTLTAVTTAAEQARAGRLPPLIAKKALDAQAAAVRGVHIAVRAGIPIAFGTDSGISRHGENAREFALLVAAGLSPDQAISSATTTAAVLLGRADRIGSIEPGKDADVIAVKGNPTEDVMSLRRVDFVMRRGIVHRLEGKPVAVSP